MFKLPPEKNFVQINDSDVKGTVAETFCVDFETNDGRVRPTRTKEIASGDDTAGEFGHVIAISEFGSQIRVWAGFQSPNDNQWDGGNSPFDTLTLDTTSVTAGNEEGDAIVFQNKQYVSTDTGVEYSSGGAYSAVGSLSLTDNIPHLLAGFGNRVYVTGTVDQVYSIDSSDTASTSGQFTLDVDLGAAYFPTVLMAGTDRIWVGYSVAASYGSAARAIIYEWDGVTENTPSKKYVLDAPAVLAGVIKDDIPYLVDSYGRLLGWTGGTFKEIARFPLKNGTFKDFGNSSNKRRAIHPRGMAIDRDEILINVANANDDATIGFNDFPSGVWAFSQKNGLYHKYAPSAQAIADTGTTNLTDYGQFRAYEAGPIKVFQPQNAAAADGGRVMFGMSYFSDADTSNIVYGVFTDDTHDNTQKSGYWVSPKIDSVWFRDNWRKVYAALDKLTSTEDKCVVKYRVDDTELYTDITWDGNGAFTSATELTDFEQGDEAQIVQGTGSGACRQMKELETGSGSQATLDSTITGVSGTSVAKISKWRKAQEITDISTEGNTLFDDGSQAHWIQFKVYMEWIGAYEFYNILVDNSKSI